MARAATLVGLVLALLGAAGGGARWVDARYAKAASVDVQMSGIQQTLLLIRRDQLAAEQRQWEQQARGRRLSDVEQARVENVKAEIERIDAQLRALQRAGRP